MEHMIVYADDLTGANAVGAELYKHGVTADIVLRETLPLPRRATIYQTSTRNKSAEESYRTVHRLFQTQRNCFYAKRVDSTLRGNPGAELDAILDRLGPEHAAVAAVCFPQAGRATCGGQLTVNGLPVTASAAGKDPLKPVASASVAEIFASQSKRKVKWLGVNPTAQGRETLACQLRQGWRQEERLFILDCESEEDLLCIADAALKSEIPFCSVDPGPLTGILAHKLGLADAAKPHGSPQARVLMILGSCNAVTKCQVQNIRRTRRDITWVHVRPQRIWQEKNYLDALADQAANSHTSVIAIVNEELMGKSSASFDATKAGTVSEAFAEIARRTLQRQNDIQNVLTCGGDITLAFCEKMGAEHILPGMQVAPLVAEGTLYCGDGRTLRLISKGGMAGGPDALLRALYRFEASP